MGERESRGEVEGGGERKVEEDGLEEEVQGKRKMKRSSRSPRGLLFHECGSNS